MKKTMAILTAVLLLTTAFTAAASASAADGILYYDSDLLKTICGTVPPEQWTEDENCRAYMTIIAMAGLWEIVEWLYAVIDGGEAGAAFLGSQGDEWDAQKDILCDTLGAVCSAALFMILNRRESNERNKL